MPWQAQLFIGQPVHNGQEVIDILKGLGVETTSTRYEIDEDHEIEMTTLKKAIIVKRKAVKVDIELYIEEEGGVRWPVDKNEDYTDALIGFPLTSRYVAGLLNTKESRPEPFVFDPLEVYDILTQVRAWWPQAQAMLWDVFY
jgi:hypothetical protein